MSQYFNLTTHLACGEDTRRSEDIVLQVGSQGSILPLILLTFDLSVKEDDTDFYIKFTGLWVHTDLCCRSFRDIMMMFGRLK